MVETYHLGTVYPRQTLWFWGWFMKPRCNPWCWNGFTYVTLGHKFGVFMLANLPAPWWAYLGNWRVATTVNKSTMCSWRPIPPEVWRRSEEPSVSCGWHMEKVATELESADVLFLEIHWWKKCFVWKRTYGENLQIWWFIMTFRYFLIVFHIFPIEIVVLESIP